MNPFSDYLNKPVKVATSEKFWSFLSFTSQIKEITFHRPDSMHQVIGFHFENGVYLEALVKNVIASRPGEPEGLTVKMDQNAVYITIQGE